jgi:hypothetical protein
MLKRMIYHRVVLAGLTVVLTCLASSAEFAKAVGATLATVSLRVVEEPDGLIF